jgi:hypothetical protein
VLTCRAHLGRLIGVHWREYDTQTFISAADEMLRERLYGFVGVCVRQAQLLIPQNRRPFVAWVTLLSYNHPSPRCRAGASHLLGSLDEVWPLGDATHPTAQLERWRPCGRSIVLRDWVRSPGTR